MEFWIPGRIIEEENCVRNHAQLLCALGSKPLIIAGQSAYRNGAFEDVTAALGSRAFAVYDRIAPNPQAQDMDEIGAFCKQQDCDYIIAIGGGSPMDAAKAVAVLGANDFNYEGLYAGSFPNKPLPIAAVPTTCGTGSEVTAFSVLNYGDTKKSFASWEVIPKLALLDAKYLNGLPHSILKDTALDTLSHLVEGYLMSDEMASEMMAERGLANFAQYLPILQGKTPTQEDLRLMLVNAALGGLVINISRTSAVHGMSYALTVKRDIPHGRACAAILGQYVLFTYPVCEMKVDWMVHLLGFENVTTFAATLKELVGDVGSFSREDLEYFTQIAAPGSINRNNPRNMTKEDVLELFHKSLG